MIELKQVTCKDRELLYNLHQKYLYEMTNYYDHDIDENGNIHYGYFEQYFTDPKRTALLIYKDVTLAGYAMLHPYSYINETPDHVMAEFTIFPRYRRQHIAKEAASLIFKTYPGKWEVKYNEKNLPAKHLWNSVTAAYHPEKYRYSDFETILLFSARDKEPS